MYAVEKVALIHESNEQKFYCDICNKRIRHDAYRVHYQKDNNNTMNLHPLPLWPTFKYVAVVCSEKCADFHILRQS